MRYQSYERPLTLFDIVGSIFRYKWRFLCVTCLMLVLSATAVLLFPKKYESEAKLFVRLGRGSAAMDPATIGQTISIQESRESEMNSIVDMLKSRGLAETVVDSIGPERILKRYSWVEIKAEEWEKQARSKLEEAIPSLAESSVSEAEISSEKLAAEKRRELAIKELQSDLKVDSPKKSTTITVAFRGAAPEVAQDVVQSVIDCYQQMHVDAYRSGGTLQFFDEQFEEQEQLLTRSEEMLRAAKNENAIVTMKGKQESLQTEITDVKKMQLSSQAELEAAEGRVAKLQQDLDSMPREILSEKTSGIEVKSTDAMRDRLYALEIQEKELAARYVSTHPELIRLREQLKSAREIMAEQPNDREQSTVGVNPVHLQIQNELVLAQANVASLTSKMSALETLEQALTQRLNKVNDLELVSESLQRQIDIARENHRNYARKLEESRINAALDQVALSNVSVVSRPSMRFKHASPNRPILAVLGVLFSLFCGVAVAITSDYSANARETSRVREAERNRYVRALELEAAQAEAAVLAARAELAESTASRRAAEQTARQVEELTQEAKQDVVVKKAK
ncbi:MAG: Wzz/FepE/Etk N-terminal domain-containing protein [Pirellulaceae bacterium]